MSKYDIFLSKIYFQDPNNPGEYLYKKRPVLVMNDETYMIETAEITSHEPRKWDIGDYAIIDWQEAGLDKPSTVRLNLLVDLAPYALDKKLGTLSNRDITNIEEINN